MTKPLPPPQELRVSYYLKKNRCPARSLTEDASHSVISEVSLRCWFCNYLNTLFLCLQAAAHTRKLLASFWCSSLLFLCSEGRDLVFPSKYSMDHTAHLKYTHNKQIKPMDSIMSNHYPELILPFHLDLSVYMALSGKICENMKITSNWRWARQKYECVFCVPSLPKALRWTCFVAPQETSSSSTEEGRLVVKGCTLHLMVPAWNPMDGAIAVSDP